MGRPPIGKRAMTGAERARRWRVLRDDELAKAHQRIAELEQSLEAFIRLLQSADWAELSEGQKMLVYGLIDNIDELLGSVNLKVENINVNAWRLKQWLTRDIERGVLKLPLNSAVQKMMDEDAEEIADESKGGQV